MPDDGPRDRNIQHSLMKLIKLVVVEGNYIYIYIYIYIMIFYYITTGCLPQELEGAKVTIFNHQTKLN
jgi:dihydrodipicolinate synthase/N-acetylneuraminate lyase